MKPLVTVIIPIYNESNNLIKLIENLKKQTFQQFEILFIDDGSQDDSKLIINEMKKEYPVINYAQQENKGVGAARNLGINLAKTELICFLDADDYYHDLFLEKMVDEIIGKDMDICFCDFVLKLPTREIKYKTKLKDNNFLLGYIRGDIKVQTASWIFRKKYLVENSIEFYEGMNWGEDFYFFCLALNNTSKVTYLEMNLTYYVQGFLDNRLSKNEVRKLDLDIEVIKNVEKGLNIKCDSLEFKALYNYRLPTILLTRLNILLKGEINKEEIVHFKRYKKYVNVNIKKWDIYSIKLCIRKILFQFRFLQRRFSSFFK